MIDFAIEAERNEGKSSADAIFEACVLRFRPILMTTTAAKRHVRRVAAGVEQWDGFGTSPAIGHRHCGRIVHEPDADALYDTGGLSLHGPLQPLDRTNAQTAGAKSVAGAGDNDLMTDRKAPDFKFQAPEKSRRAKPRKVCAGRFRGFSNRSFRQKRRYRNESRRFTPPVVKISFGKQETQFKKKKKKKRFRFICCLDVGVRSFSVHRL